MDWSTETLNSWNYAKQKALLVTSRLKNLDQNTVVERMNKTLLEKVRCMRLIRGLPNSFWAVVINDAYFVTNRSLSIEINFKVLKEVWSDKLFDYTFLNIFCCPRYVHVGSEMSQN